MPKPAKNIRCCPGRRGRREVAPHGNFGITPIIGTSGDRWDVTCGILETGIANGVSVIAVNVADDDAYDKLLCDAAAKGMPIVTFNIDDSKGAEGLCRMAFMGRISSRQDT